MCAYEFFERMKQGAEAGWEGVKETIRNGGNIFEGGQVVQDYLNGIDRNAYQTDEAEE